MIALYPFIPNVIKQFINTYLTSFFIWLFVSLGKSREIKIYINIKTQLVNIMGLTNHALIRCQAEFPPWFSTTEGVALRKIFCNC
jgi:hypothetical protein